MKGRCKMFLSLKGVHIVSFERGIDEPILEINTELPFPTISWFVLLYLVLMEKLLMSRVM